MLPIWLLTTGIISLFVHPLLYAPYLGNALYSLAILVVSLVASNRAWRYSWLGKNPGTIQEQVTGQKLFTWSAIFSGLLLSYVIWKLRQSGR